MLRFALADFQHPKEASLSLPGAVNLELSVSITLKLLLHSNLFNSLLTPPSFTPSFNNYHNTLLGIIPGILMPYFQHKEFALLE